ncbi:EAL domain-containing protein [Pontibacterium granulatum]|uniref:EAL domain-containing protein n=1 Tax=Pontibacterium granulatum TaxID=2036029 RepID=UPI002499B40F|nr:EAL domain-containing protein [Pontibacterium granulatum]MDI3324582.1 EAL domain-containing protein [Pontibacterium granulatum]
MLSAPKQLKSTQPRLLLIDGNRGCCTRLQETLGLTAQHLHCFSTQEALTAEPLNADDIVLLGLEHFDNSAFQTLRVLTTLLPTQPIIVLAPAINGDQGDALIRQGASDFISLDQASPETVLRAFRYARDAHKDKAEINRLRNSDPLTGLGNRRSFYQSIIQLISQVQDSKLQIALLTVDLDGFSKFNGQCGPKAADEVIIQLRDRLQSAVSNAHSIHRLGNDEFAITLTCAPDENLHQLTREQLKSLLPQTNMPFRTANRSSILPGSIGVAYCQPGATVELDELIRRAAMARHQAKQERPGTYRIYDPTFDQQEAGTSELEPELAFALRANQFELFFQPQVDLKTGKIAGAEALIRWRHPRRGLIMPGEFISLAERNGMIIPIGYWAIHQAGMKLKALQLEGYDNCRISVNLSFRQFQDSNLPHTIHRIISQNEINSAFLEFELTESALISDEQHVGYCLQELSNLSIDFALDDFGTGYSSFALLQKLPISTLKIDRSFIRNVADNPNDAEIVRAIINLAHSLDKKVVAEGVENTAQLDWLMQNGCDQVQGYLYGPPVPFKEFMRMLEKA